MVKARWTAFLAFVCFAACPYPSAAARNAPGASLDQDEIEKPKVLNERPLVGILSEYGPPAPENYTYIAASYIKFVESAGARAVPIQCDLPREELLRRFNAVNALLIPGGGQPMEPGHPFFDATQLLLEAALKANDEGDHFPVHGTCLGFEVLAILASKNTSVLDTYDGLDSAGPLRLARHAGNSAFFAGMPREVLRAAQEQPIAMENHESGLSPEAYDASKPLKEFFEVLSLSSDRRGRDFVSTMQARKYPVTATQWHPEKNAFEWPKNLHVPHSEVAVELTHAVARFLVSEARRSSHRPASNKEEDDLLIYNYSPLFSGKVAHEGVEVAFDQIYVFPAHQN